MLYNFHLLLLKYIIILGTKNASLVSLTPCYDVKPDETEETSMTQVYHLNKQSSEQTDKREENDDFKVMHKSKKSR